MKLNVLKQATLVFVLLGGICAGPAQAMNPVMEAAKAALESARNIQSQEYEYICFVDSKEIHSVMATSKAEAEAKFNGQDVTCG